LLIRKKNDNEEEEERVGEGVCHKGCHPHWHSTFRCGKPGSTYIGRAPTWEAHLAESRCGNCFSKSVVVKIISQKGQNKNFLYCTSSSFSDQFILSSMPL
jgi:hypothetical protein